MFCELRLLRLNELCKIRTGIHPHSHKGCASIIYEVTANTRGSFVSVLLKELYTAIRTEHACGTRTVFLDCGNAAENYVIKWPARFELDASYNLRLFRNADQREMLSRARCTQRHKRVIVGKSCQTFAVPGRAVVRACKAREFALALRWPSKINIEW